MSFRFGTTANSSDPANESTNITCSATRTLIISDVLSAMHVIMELGGKQRLLRNAK